MGELLVLSYFLYLQYTIAYGDIFSTVVPIDIGPNTTHKFALRYGFQKTGECHSYEKSYICMQKCLDLNYDVAHSDKNCKCTCFTKTEKAKYTMKYNSTRTKWKLGAPTTSIPPWAQDKKKKELSKTTESAVVELDDDETLDDGYTKDANEPKEEAASNAIPLSNVAKGTEGGVTDGGTAGASLATGAAGGKGGESGTESGTVAGTAATGESATSAAKGAAETGSGAATTAANAATDAAATEAKAETTGAA